MLLRTNRPKGDTEMTRDRVGLSETRRNAVSVSLPVVNGGRNVTYIRCVWITIQHIPL
jgi:hypothetical protein